MLCGELLVCILVSIEPKDSVTNKNNFYYSCDACAFEIKIETPTTVMGYVRQK
jgi:hypothetical protein